MLPVTSAYSASARPLPSTAVLSSLKPASTRPGESWRVKLLQKGSVGDATTTSNITGDTTKDAATKSAAMHVDSASADDDIVVVDEGDGIAHSGSDPARLGSDVIVIHPGSRTLRIGKASDSIPHSVPHVIARRVYANDSLGNRDATAPSTMAVDGQAEERTDTDSSADNEFIDSLDAYCDETGRFIKQRLKAAKFRTVVGALQQVVSFNGNSQPEIIPEHNDVYRIEWTEVEPSTKFVVGDAVSALHIPPQVEEFRLRYPFRNGQLNWAVQKGADTDSDGYQSAFELANDLECIWSSAVVDIVKIPQSEWKSYSVVLVLPDLLPRESIEFLLDLVLRTMRFRAATVMLESVCASWGAGISQACVVDVGAQKTSIACVEDGLVIPSTRINIKYGGDDIIAILQELLVKRANFPYRECSLAHSYDRTILEHAYESFCSLNEEDVTIHVYELYVRTPHKPTRLYKFKMFEEVMMTPLCLLYPQHLNLEKRPRVSNTAPSAWRAADTKTDSRSDLQVAVHENFMSALPLHKRKFNGASADNEEIGDANVLDEAEIANSVEAAENTIEEPGFVPLDKAIAMSILSTSHSLSKKLSAAAVPLDEDGNPIPISLSGNEETRLKKLMSSILLVGGGMSGVQGVHKFLAERILPEIHRVLAEVFDAPAKKLGLTLEEAFVMATPRDMDPRVLSWKGGAIATRIESINQDCWITREEWVVFGTPLVGERFLFQW